MEVKNQEQEAEKLKLDGRDEDDDQVKKGIVKEIGSINPIADFNAMITDRKVDRVSDAISQMQKIIERFISNSLKGDLYDKAFECFKELRHACVKEDEAENFNGFAALMKSEFASGDQPFFDKVKDAGVSLITKGESFSSTVD